MFDIGLQEMLLIGVLALLVFGPSKLPELGRMFGRAMREFRRASDEFRSTVETNLNINEPDPIIAPPTPTPETPAPVSDIATLPSEQEPVGAFEDAGTGIVEEHGEPFLARRGARLFHRRQCVWVARIAEPDRVYFKRFAEAREQGLQTCPVCEPWDSSS